MEGYGRVVLAIVGILTFQFCLYYIEQNTNKGEETNKFKDYFISYSQCLLYQSQWESLNVLNTGYSPLKNLNLSRICLYLSSVYIRNFWTQGHHLFIKKTPWRKFFCSLLLFKTTENGKCWVFTLKDLQRWTKLGKRNCPVFKVVNLHRLDVSSPTVLEQAIGASFPLRISTPSSSMGEIWITTWMCVNVFTLITFRTPVNNIMVVQRIWAIGNFLLHLLNSEISGIDPSQVPQLSWKWVRGNLTTR